jgi:hypothetical protein
MWWSIIEITTANKFPKLKSLLVPEQSLRLRLGGSGVVSMLTFCRYLCTTQHSISFELPSFCEFHTLIPVGRIVSPCLVQLEDRTAYLSIIPLINCFGSYFGVFDNF